jgi:hypothetical protein
LLLGFACGIRVWQAGGLAAWAQWFARAVERTARCLALCLSRRSLLAVLALAVVLAAKLVATHGLAHERLLATASF